jgi:hypothetical protein
VAKDAPSGFCRTETLVHMDEWIEEVIEHDGLILRDRALREGVDPDEIMKALRTGRIRRIQRCVYVRRTDEVVPLALARAAVITCGVADAVASHRTAARVHGIAIPDGRLPEHVTVPRLQRRIRRRDLVCHARSLGLMDVEVHDGVPVTSVTRSLVDLVDEVSRLDGVWAVDDALRRHLVTRKEITRQLGDRRGGKGVVRSRVAEADGAAESILETAGRLTLADAGVRLPVPQYPVFCGDVLIARLDGAYPDVHLGIEFDGAGVHSTPDALFRDRARQNALHELGWTLLRFTWWDVVHDPKGFAASVRRALARG